MKLPFHKYQGTGNDFVIVDNRKLKHDFNKEEVTQLCHRKWGIGSDGLILIQDHPELDFEMVFYNPDGSQSFCGNGSRCAVTFAKTLGLLETNTEFLSTDGVHTAEIYEMGRDQWVSLKMHDVSSFERIDSDLLINTGSPHYLILRGSLDNFDLINDAQAIRYNDRFKDEGVNVNFISANEEYVQIRTYERGVEDETLSCGTGVTAAALGNHIFSNKADGTYKQAMASMGGSLEVEYTAVNGQFTDIYLKGPAKEVFKGEVELIKSRMVNPHPGVFITEIDS